MTKHELASRRCARTRSIVAVGSTLVFAAIALSGCSSIKAAIAKKAVSLLPHSAALNAFTAKVKTGDSTTYDVTYETTGTSPLLVHYAALPPHDIAFDGDVSGGGGEFIQNATGDFACTQKAGAGSAWSCIKLTGTALDAAKAEQVLYSGTYWVDFLRVYSIASHVAGVTITTSSKTVNGFAMSCVVVTGGKSNPGSSTWCVTTSGILGYVSVSTTKTAFEIKSYSTSPPASLFTLPPGATVSTIPTTTSTAS